MYLSNYYFSPTTTIFAQEPEAQNQIVAQKLKKKNLSTGYITPITEVFAMKDEAQPDVRNQIVAQTPQIKPQVFSLQLLLTNDLFRYLRTFLTQGAIGQAVTENEQLLKEWVQAAESSINGWSKLKME